MGVPTIQPATFDGIWSIDCFFWGSWFFRSQSMMHCLAVLAFKVRKGTGFLHASDLPVSDDEDEATSWCCVIEAWGMIWHDSSPWDWLFWCLLVAFPCLFGIIKLLFGMCLFITHYYLRMFFFDTLELLCLWCVCWAWNCVLSFGDVMDVFQAVLLFVLIDDIVLCSRVIGICATHSENELKDSCFYDECPNP